MKQRHIDELFLHQPYNNKIIFEHKLLCWQRDLVSLKYYIVCNIYISILFFLFKGMQHPEKVTVPENSSVSSWIRNLNSPSTTSSTGFDEVRRLKTKKLQILLFLNFHRFLLRI